MRNARQELLRVRIARQGLLALTSWLDSWNYFLTLFFFLVFPLFLSPLTFLMFVSTFTVFRQQTLLCSWHAWRSYTVQVDIASVGHSELIALPWAGFFFWYIVCVCDNQDTCEVKGGVKGCSLRWSLGCGMWLFSCVKGWWLSWRCCGPCAYARLFPCLWSLSRTLDDGEEMLFLSLTLCLYSIINNDELYSMWILYQVPSHIVSSSCHACVCLPVYLSLPCPFFYPSVM